MKTNDRSKSEVMAISKNWPEISPDLPSWKIYIAQSLDGKSQRRQAHTRPLALICIEILGREQTRIHERTAPTPLLSTKSLNHSHPKSSKSQLQVSTKDTNLSTDSSIKTIKLCITAINQSQEIINCIDQLNS
jgi:hypothetical protein